MDVYSIIIEKDHLKNYFSCNLEMYFLNREEFIGVLNDRRMFDYDNECFLKLKEFITKYTVSDFKEKTLFKLMFSYVMELYRKLNVRNTMANTFAKIKSIKD